MAEAVFTDIVKTRSLTSKITKIDSAGTAGYHVGSSPDPRTIDVCVLNKVDICHDARQLCETDFEFFDWILVMDESNYEDVISLKPRNSKTQVRLFGEFDPNGVKIIKDPYYGGKNGFEYNFEQVKRSSIGFLTTLGLIAN